MTTAVALRRPVGELLRDWRQRRRLSQLELSLRAEISTRHLSFVETGRSRPSSAMVLRLGPASEWLVWPLPAMLSPFVGVYYPIGTLPAWMQAVGHVLPPSYVFEGMRALVKGEAFSPASLLLGAGLAIVQLLLAAWLFARVFRYSVQTGLLARYSAETVN